MATRFEDGLHSAPVSKIGLFFQCKLVTQGGYWSFPRYGSNCFQDRIQVRRFVGFVHRWQHTHTYTHTHAHTNTCTHRHTHQAFTRTRRRAKRHSTTCESCHMGWLRLVGSFKLKVSFAKETYKRDDILQKRPMILAATCVRCISHILYTATCESYGVATISRLLKSIGLFCKRAL